MTSGNDAEVQPRSRPPAYYAEDHCALNWRFASAGLLAPVVVIAAGVAAVALDNAASWALLGVVGLATVSWIAFGQMLPYAWPLGIRLDSDGLRIGGVRWAEQHPGRTRRKATVPHQYGQVFACRLDGVQHIGVTRDRKAIKTSIRHASHGIRRTPLGNLAVPFMRAAVVILVDREQCTLPRIGPARGLLSVNWSGPGFHQPLWVVPTRHPAELEAALAALPLPPGTVGDPYPAPLTSPRLPTGSLPDTSPHHRLTSSSWNEGRMTTQNPWRTLSSRTIYRNPWLALREDKVIRPDGAEGIYGVVEMRPSCGIVAINEENQIALVGQWRYVHNKYSIEIPTGGSEQDEAPLDAAKRELQEETGLTAQDWIALGTIDNSNGVTTDVAYLFLAKNLTAGPSLPQGDEQVELRWMPFTDAVLSVIRGEITESVTVAAILKTEFLGRAI